MVTLWNLSLICGNVTFRFLIRETGGKTSGSSWTPVSEAGPAAAPQPALSPHVSAEVGQRSPASLAGQEVGCS